ncbi:hypothetical protein EC2729250_2909 [Escherichia coli 2729250]|nr:hypothetical protein EC2860050_2977 [Escherichia coli 2860050]EMW73955.1 hypothetical protein EC2747800_2968 [Escherichia coli 2747800]ENA51192.1 hypothetical protein EC2729250_2909 [Escherichia coli 2729250]
MSEKRIFPLFYLDLVKTIPSLQTKIMSYYLQHLLTQRFIIKKEWHTDE